MKDQSCYCRDWIKWTSAAGYVGIVRKGSRESSVKPARVSSVMLPEVGDYILYNEVLKDAGVGNRPFGMRGTGRVVAKTDRLCIIERTISEGVSYRESILINDFANGLFVFRKLERVVYSAGKSYHDLSVDSDWCQECVANVS